MDESITRYFTSLCLFLVSFFLNSKLIMKFLFEWHTPRYRLDIVVEINIPDTKCYKNNTNIRSHQNPRDFNISRNLIPLQLYLFSRKHWKFFFFNRVDRLERLSPLFHLSGKAIPFDSLSLHSLKYRVNADIIEIPFRGSCSIFQPLVFATHIVAITFPPADVK